MRKCCFIHSQHSLLLPTNKDYICIDYTQKTNLISTSGKRGSTNYHINWVWYIDQRYRILELNMTLTDSNT